ncbi:helix-turn-helix domain-containing protein [Streptomyces sp. NPDC101175]|uniref:helix-turn-helix domain-containing protein n=1 Tax=Streptomyces sp. NPDC101175 TaxID=3366123 RepID=UPI003836A28A
MNKEEAEAFGQRVKGLRQKHDYQSVRALAEATGLSHGYLAKLERGEIENPSQQTLERIASAFSESVQQILGESDINLGGGLPDMRTYFRRTLGVSLDEADELVGLVQKYQQGRKGGTHEENQ